MKTDLYCTKEDQLAIWCKKKGFFSKVDLTYYGLDHQYISAWRRICEFVNEGRVRKLPKEEAIFRGLTQTAKTAWYEWIGQ